MRKTFSIPDKYFDYGNPIIYGDDMYYRIGGEELYERQAAFGSDDQGVTKMTLTSAWIWGFDNINKYSAEKSTVVGYDLNSRTVTINLVKEDS